MNLEQGGYPAPIGKRIEVEIINSESRLLCLKFNENRVDSLQHDRYAGNHILWNQYNGKFQHYRTSL